MDKKYKDTDLRDALKRKYSDTPQLPADFMTKMEKRLEAKPDTKTRYLWSRIAAAACILMTIGIGLTLMHKDEEQSKPILAETTVKPRQEVSKVGHESEPHKETKKQLERSQQCVPTPVRKRETERQITTKQESGDDGLRATIHDAEQQSVPNLHYAAHKQTNDTIPYQDPARVDDFIAKFAAYYNVRQGELKCSVPPDSNLVSTVYVFPDNKEIDVFAHLLQVACWYRSESPGYRLSFSHQQFFFELKDMRRQLQYRWIAERINGKILLYGTNTPIGTEESSACYQEYRNELMHIHSINHNKKKM